MKTRNGFVSNSSSSSFIITIGKVIDQEKFLICNVNGKKLMGEWGLYCGTGEELKNEISEGTFEYDFDCDWAGVFVNEQDIIKCCDQFPQDNFFVYVGDGPSEDYNFWNEEHGYYDYDVDLDDFDKFSIKLNEESSECGVEIIESQWGAGRNG